MTQTIGNVPPSTTGRLITPELRAFFNDIPKVELHCHLLGTVRQATFTELAQKHRAPLSSDEIATFYRRDGKPVGVLKALRALESHALLSLEDFERITYEYLEDAAQHNVRHAEFFWNPTASLRGAGLDYTGMQGAIVDGIKRAGRDHGISGLLIPSIDREAHPDDAVAMVRLMLSARDAHVAGIGIDYRETDRPPELFAEAYALAKAAGLHTTAHAGEFGTPWQNVETVVQDLKVDRVDHGYTIIDNPTLARTYAERGIVFTIVPTNSYYLRTLAPETWALDHPIRRMAELGLRLHPNTDDPTFHKVTPGGAWELMYSHLGFTIADLKVMMLNGIDGSWAPEATKAGWRVDWGSRFDRLAAQISAGAPL